MIALWALIKGKPVATIRHSILCSEVRYGSSLVDRALGCAFPEQ